VGLGVALPHTTTNERGEYRFAILPWWGRYTVYADDEEAGYSSFSTGSSGQSQPTEVEITPDHREAELNVLMLVPVPRVYAEWTKDISCPAGTVYRDIREYAGRQEFCEKLLPGSLRVKHGPARFWINPDFEPSRGNYTNGRQTGSWRECDKNNHCRHVDYPLIYPEEQHPGLKPEVPISFHNGKYVFDFGSCWSTWVTQGEPEEVEFNIGGPKHRCEVSYFPPHLTNDQMDRMINCWVPFSVGRRELPSLDLMHELPKLGFPQFCQTQSAKPTKLMIVDKQFRDFAYTLDLECATIERDAAGEEVFIFRFNRYVTDLVKQVAETDGPLMTRVCISVPAVVINHLVVDQPTDSFQTPDGTTLFRFHLSPDPVRARKQKQCIRKNFSLQKSCQ
jgi:hypothetical protein